MAVIATDRFNRNSNEQYVKLKIDQKIKGVPLAAGDECYLPLHEAIYLKNIGRVDFATPEKPKQASR